MSPRMCRECGVPSNSVGANTARLCWSCSLMVTCAACGLRYSDVYDACPLNELGCGVPKRFVSTITTLNACERVGEDLIGEVVHLCNSVRVDDLGDLAAAANELVKASGKLLRDVEKLRAALRVVAIKRAGKAA